MTSLSRIGAAMLALCVCLGAHAEPGRYSLQLDCTNWCGESKMLIEETVLDSAAGELHSREQLHPREFEKAAGSGADSARLAGVAKGSFQVATVAVGQENQIMVMESILDTATGRVVSRRWWSPRDFELFDAEATEQDLAPSADQQLAGSTFGEGIRAQDFLAVVDTVSGEVVSRVRRDTRSPTRRDAACLPSWQWTEPASEAGPYALSITTRGPDDRQALIYETVLDTRDGRVVSHRRVHQRAYRIVR